MEAQITSTQEVVKAQDSEIKVYEKDGFSFRYKVVNKKRPINWVAKIERSLNSTSEDEE